MARGNSGRREARLSFQGAARMTAYALISGQLFRAPEQRTAKSGKTFVAATVKSKDGAEIVWWRGGACNDPAQPANGDAVSVQGPFKVELYDKDGGIVPLSISQGRRRA